jgi:hemerythrin-like metal-binding protein
MPLFTWSDSYSVNSPEIDTQHKKLFDLINNLHDAMIRGKGKEVVGQILDGLIDYTRVHFADEEKMLEAINYPDLPAHLVEHDAFIRKVFQLQTDYRSGKQALTLPVMDFLKNWLLNHILKTDKKYMPFVTEPD